MIIKDNAIVLDERYDSGNAADFERELFALGEQVITETGEKQITLDASNLSYISSAGLRVLLKAKKKYDSILLINVSKEVYDILEVTGFTTLLSVKKAFRNISLDGAREIGHGLSSVVYRIDRDSLVKIYNKRIPFWKIQREVDFAKKAFLFGIRTIISYDIVKCGDQFGTVFELIDSDVFSRYLNEHPEQFEAYAAKYVELMKECHSTEVDETFSDVQPLWNTWIDMLSAYFTPEELKKLHTMVNAVPKRRTFIHSDIHANNIMVRDGELVLIDMADIGYGHPIFDIGPICFHYKYMEQVNMDMADNLIVLNHELRQKMWAYVKAHYITDPDPKRHEMLVRIYECFGALRCGLIAAKQSQMDEQTKPLFVQIVKDVTLPQIDEILPLIPEYLK